MIKYKLKCENDHEFEGWFPSSKEFDRQCKKGMVNCPSCDTPNVGKALMAPRINKGKTRKAKKESLRRAYTNDTMMMASRAKAVMRRIKQEVEKEFENVGNNFYNEAIKAHEGTRDDKIYGTPTKDEVNELLDEGIDLFHVPDIKDN
jgi:hypothetical protein